MRYFYFTENTPEGYYIYDRSINSIFAVREEEYHTLKSLQHEGKFDGSALIQQYQQMGMLRPNQVETIRHPASDTLCHHCSNRMSSLVLQVTQQCNLRCSYCAYSGLYYNREHNSQRMSFETARRAIDFFLSHAAESESIHLGFYGGEPLLEFELIQKCVAYVNRMVEGKAISFGMTTNGTLLTDEKIRFLQQHDFGLTISLDGAKHEHDACRTFPDGSGTFDIVMSNVARIRELYPAYAKKLLVSTVISPTADLNHVLEYFEGEDVLEDSFIIMNTISPTGLKEKRDYEESFHLVRSYEFMKFLFYLVGKVGREHVSDLVIQSQRQYENLYHALQRHAPIPKYWHHGGPCLPGVRKLFVTVDGHFFPCEKVTESAACMNIGSVDEGFCMERMQKLLNIGELSAEECKTCWALPNCEICAAQLECVDGQTELRRADKLAACRQSQQTLLFDLYQMCILHEFGYRINEKEALI